MILFLFIYYFFLKRGLQKPLAEICPGLNHTYWQVLEQEATLKTRNMSPGNTRQDLSESPGSAVRLLLALASPRWNSHRGGTYAVCWNAWERVLFSFFFPPSVSCFPGHTSAQAISVWLIKFTWGLQSPSLHQAATLRALFLRGYF